MGLSACFRLSPHATIISGMDKALKIVNELKDKGIIKDYAIGGGIATILYTEPLLTYDLDIFFIPAEEKEKIFSLSPIYDFLKKKGYKPHQESIIIGNIPVQFLPPYNDLIKEAIENSIEAKYKNIKTRAFRPEYLIAIMVQTFRAKDKERAIKVLDEAKIDKRLLTNILEKHKLKGKFNNFIRKFYEE